MCMRNCAMRMSGAGKGAAVFVCERKGLRWLAALAAACMLLACLCGPARELAFGASGDEAAGASGGSVTVTYVPDPADAGAVSVVENVVNPMTGEGITGSTAMPNHGRVFVGWYQGNTLVTSDALLGPSQVRAHMVTAGTGGLKSTTFVARFEKPSPALALAKAITAPPANGTHFVVGDTVHFAITATNTGNITLTEVVIDDTLASLAPLTNLVPGESRTVSYDYTVTEADLDAGYVSNVAVAQASVKGWATKVIKSEPASIAALVKEAPPQSTYVICGAYPAAGGTVDVPYEVVEDDSGSGLSPVTDSAAEGYDFAGWFRHDGVLVSGDPVLGVDVIRAGLGLGGEKPSYVPALYLAYFVPRAEEIPDGPDAPDTPDVPGESGGTDDVVKPGVDGGSDAVAPDDGQAGGADAEEAPDKGAGESAKEKPTYHSADKPSVAAKGMPQTGDGLCTVATVLLLVAMASITIAWAAQRGRQR